MENTVYRYDHPLKGWMILLRRNRQLDKREYAAAQSETETPAAWYPNIGDACLAARMLARANLVSRA